VVAQASQKAEAAVKPVEVVAKKEVVVVKA